ncbi:hypothetical protein BT96DRAFT_1010188 [Gymnopus androsaceus JB14]|uniref:Uncharacterized protein n=1 Tax=Gymnopus androsaceus JB14 TaxID=1447944 RepID=A0A6A4GB27_9AGAR|nr:hypothetical protein BT96DRAFT_1010188 [Gymnopus androsaceus JB14]
MHRSYLLENRREKPEANLDAQVKVQGAPKLGSTMRNSTPCHTNTCQDNSRQCPNIPAREDIICVYVYVFTIAPLISTAPLENQTKDFHGNNMDRRNDILLIVQKVNLDRPCIPPVYKDKGSLLWVKILVIAFAGVFIPLISPRKYIRVDIELPKPTVHLPPLCDYDYAEYLKQRSFRYLDPTIVTKRRLGNIFLSLIRVFAKEFADLVALIVLQSLLDFAMPIFIKNLLGYLETDGATAFFKFWVFYCFS